MENIFENAYFGKPYKTRAGYKALYLKECSFMPHGKIYEVRCENTTNYSVGSSGLVADSKLCTKWSEEFDIIGEWEEEIDEEKLEMLAFNNYCKDCHYCESANAKTLEEKYEACQKSECYRKTYVWKLINGFKAGYRKAKEEK